MLVKWFNRTACEERVLFQWYSSEENDQIWSTSIQILNKTSLTFSEDVWCFRSGPAHLRNQVSSTPWSSGGRCVCSDRENTWRRCRLLSAKLSPPLGAVQAASPVCREFSVIWYLVCKEDPRLEEHTWETSLGNNNVSEVHQVHSTCVVERRLCSPCL